MFLNHLVLFTTLLVRVFGSVLPDASSLSKPVVPEHAIVARQTACPAIWSEIAADLRSIFAGCNNGARNAIRFAFHDAAGYTSLTKKYGPATGGADGSLLLNDSEIARSDNNPMQVFRNNFLLPKYNEYKNRGVGAADFVQFAGVIGTGSCPGGPVYKTVIGRSDDFTACPPGTLPQAFGVNSSASALLTLWAQKGFNARELAALLGAHSVSQAFAQRQNGIPPGGPQDSTFTTWDTNYFKQTQNGTAPYSFNSDKNLAKLGTASGAAFTEFGNSLDTWSVAFKAAMYKLSILGIPQSKVASLIDCSSVV